MDKIVPKFGEIYRCKIGFTNLTGSKNRPAIIISSKEYNSSRDDVIVASITSKTPESEDLGFEIVDLQLAGLLKQSYIKPVIFTLHKLLIFDKLGELSQNDLPKLKDMLSRSIIL